MKQFDPATLQRLKDNYRSERGSVYLVKIWIGGDWVYITDADAIISWGGADYYPGYITDESIDDIETTSEPNPNDVGIELDAKENSFVPLFMTEGWMNGSITIYEQHYDEQGLIFTKNVFEGLLDSRDLDPEKKKIEVTAASVWADFDKAAGNRTNTKSQQRHYPGDTGFDHVAKARRKIYWGREAPSSSQSGSDANDTNDRFQLPRLY